MTDRPPWGDLLRVGGVTLGLFISFGILLPTLPLWAQTHVGSMTNVGLATMFAAGAGLILGRPIAARMMEGRPRAPTIIVGTILCSATCGIFTFQDSLWPIVITRTVQGVGFGMVTTAAVSAITDLAPPAIRGQVLGYFGASNALSLIIGPALGGWMAGHYGFNVTFWVAAAMGLLPLFALIGLREPPKPEVHGRMRVLDALPVPRLKPLVVAHLCAMLVHGATLTFLPAHFKGHQGWMSAEMFYVIDGAVMILFRLAVGRRFDVLSRGVFVIGGLLFMIATPLLLGFASGDLPWCLAAIAYGIGFGAYVPGAQALVGDVLPEAFRARGFALFMLAFDLAVAMGGVVFGVVADRYSVAMALGAATLAPLLALTVHAIWRPSRTPPTSAPGSPG